jgi:hypothetical protein
LAESEGGDVLVERLMAAGVGWRHEDRHPVA